MVIPDEKVYRDRINFLRSMYKMQARYPASPPPLSNKDTYTTWPGGVDPTARVYDSVGGKRKARMSGKSPRSALKRRKTPKRRMSRKASRKNRKANRRTRRH